MLLHWAVFDIAAGVKFCRLTALIRRHLLGVPTIGGLLWSQGIPVSDNKAQTNAISFTN